MRGIVAKSKARRTCLIRGVTAMLITGASSALHPCRPGQSCPRVCDWQCWQTAALCSARCTVAIDRVASMPDACSTALHGGASPATPGAVNRIHANAQHSPGKRRMREVRLGRRFFMPDGYFTSSTAIPTT